MDYSGLKHGQVTGFKRPKQYVALPRGKDLLESEDFSQYALMVRKRLHERYQSQRYGLQVGASMPPTLVLELGASSGYLEQCQRAFARASPRDMKKSLVLGFRTYKQRTSKNGPCAGTSMQVRSSTGLKGRPEPENHPAVDDERRTIKLCRTTPKIPPCPP